MKFSEVTYTRPDMDKLREQAKAAAQALRSAADADEAARAYTEWDEAASGYSTQMNICYIRHSINTEDEYYSAEEDFFDENSPLFTEMNEDISRALAESPYRAELEKRFSRVLFTNNDIFLKSFSPVAVPYMQKDNKLVTEYEKLIASAQIDFDGELHIGLFHEAQAAEHFLIRECLDAVAVFALVLSGPHTDLVAGL